MPTLLTNKGKEVITSRFLPGAAAPTLYIAWGTGIGESAPTDTTLFAEAPQSRVAAIVAQETTLTAKDTIKAVATLHATENMTITNAGLFDAPESGILIVKSNFGEMNLHAGDSITFALSFQMGE